MKKYTISNILILLSVIATIAASLDERLFVFGMNHVFLNQGNYHVYILQFFTSNFIHGGFFHLIFNSVFIYYFGNQVEQIVGHKKYLVFFLLNAIFVGIGLTVFGSGNTIGISGFALAVLTYYTLYLKSIGDPEYTGGVTAIVINILIGFTPGISFLGHFFGAVFGGIYYYILKLLKR